METKHDDPTRVPEWMKANTEPITTQELMDWNRWARSENIIKTKTGNRFIRLLNTIESFRDGTNTIIESP